MILKIVKNFASNFSCVTNGEKGVFFLDNDDLVQLKPPKINAKDTLAAGDVWHGAFTYAVSTSFYVTFDGQLIRNFISLEISFQIRAGLKLNDSNP